MGKEQRTKKNKEALVEHASGKISARGCEAVLMEYGCDESEARALTSSAPKTIKPRTKPAFKGEVLPLELLGGSGWGLTK